ncbi:MAG: DUF4038 domain-containing protein [Chloroflexota bacterium]
MREQRQVHRWGRIEAAVDAPSGWADGGGDPLRDVQVEAEFVAPTGERRRVPGFWDGGNTWRVRFSPDEVGTWRYTTTAQLITHHSSPITSSGTFECVPHEGDNPLYTHGPPRMAPNRRHLQHADGTPFFWLSDTVWNGAMLATPEEWQHYIRTRLAQGFTAAQYVSTQYRTVPDGGPDGPPYTTPAGESRIEAVRPAFFRRMDARLDALVEAGLVGAPVLLWAIGGGENAFANPGHVLSEEDCILLARYQVARWHAHPVVFILNGDGRYTGEHAARWQRIGRAVFSHDHDGAPVATHPGGRQWVGAEFRDESWLDVLGYQSGHGDDDATWRWLAEDGPARHWPEAPHQAVVNLEPCYEYHQAYHSRQPHPPEHVRRACYWSLLVTPTMGVTYGGHGVWGWDDGSGPPVAHPNTGTPLPWQQALEMPGAQQMRHLRAFLGAIPWWTLRPDQALLREQPGKEDVRRFVAAARSEDGTLAALYLPQGGSIRLDTTRLEPNTRVTWLNPRDGSRAEGPALTGGEAKLEAPDAEDWLLVLQAA